MEIPTSRYINPTTVMKAVVIVLDGVGIGEAPDADSYGDAGSNTLANTAVAVGGLNLPHLQALGLGNIGHIFGVPPASPPLSFYGKMAPLSPGKDTLTGHWEMMGVIRKSPPHTYPDGFPQEIISRLQEEIGLNFLYGKPASGTEIINLLGVKHTVTRQPILYTSADSVMQIAAHEEVIPVSSLYSICVKIRDLAEKYGWVDRVIARPFTGYPGNYQRLNHLRKDFVALPPEENLLHILSSNSIPTVAVGIIGSIFAGEGLTAHEDTRSNNQAVEKCLQWLKKDFSGFLFANLEDFDMLYGHRNNPQGLANALQQFDARIPELLEYMTRDDLLILTADHGNDPTTPSTDHSREYVPLLVYSPGSVGNRTPSSLGERKSLADLGATLSDFFQVPPPPAGSSFLHLLRGR